jgi:hypothetical protein
MIQTLNKHVKFRNDNNAIFICDCKRLIDLKIEYKFNSFMDKLNKGLEKTTLDKEEKNILSDFEKLKLLSELKIRSLKEADFKEGMALLDNTLENNRVRDSNFLYDKFRKYPQFFIGIFLDKKIIGLICGFPREDYLLVSEIAIDSRFQRRSFGDRLLKEFEKRAIGKYKRINIGACDNSLGFYEKQGYNPFLLIQFKKRNYDLSNFENLIDSESKFKEFEDFYMIEIHRIEVSINKITALRDKYPDASFQYIFTKNLFY